MNVILAGSPELTIDTFNEILKQHRVVAVITQPDRKKGRGQLMTPTPVSVWAEEHFLPVLKPKKIDDIYTALSFLNFDMLITFAYGQKISDRILKLPKFLSLNIHGSLLPKYRGASPVNHAILNADKQIGISLIEMTNKMDAGDIIFQASRKLFGYETTKVAYELISELSVENINDWLKKIDSLDYTRTSQGLEYSLAPKISKEQGCITKKMTQEEAIRVIKAFNPNPVAYTMIDELRIKLFDAQVKEHKDALKIKVKKGNIFVTSYQYPGKQIKNVL